MRVLVVDDEPGVRQIVDRALTAHAMDVDTADSATAALDLVVSRAYDLVLLDVALPGVREDSLLQAVLQSAPGQRVMMLSAIGDVRTKVYFLDRGAVDYLPKPFALSELVARVRVHARPRLGPAIRPNRRPIEDRAVGGRATARAGMGQERWVRNGSAHLDVEGRRLHADGRVISLSQRECLVLAELMQRPAEVCRRDDVLAAVWGEAGANNGNVLDVYIGRLRAKLPVGTIRTVRNAGYVFTLP